MKIVQKQIKEHKESFDPENIQDLIDLCLEKQKGTSDDRHIFTGKHRSIIEIKNLCCIIILAGGNSHNHGIQE